MPPDGPRMRRAAAADHPPAGRFAGMTAGAFPGLLDARLDGVTDPVERLHRLAMLHRAGAITDAEFVEQRGAVLDGA